MGVDLTMSRHQTIAKRLKNAMKGLGTKEEQLYRNIIGHSGREMQLISQAYNELYGASKSAKKKPKKTALEKASEGNTGKQGKNGKTKSRSRKKIINDEARDLYWALSDDLKGDTSGWEEK